MGPFLFKGLWGILVRGLQGLYRNSVASLPVGSPSILSYYRQSHNPTVLASCHLWSTCFCHSLELERILCQSVPIPFGLADTDSVTSPKNKQRAFTVYSHTVMDGVLKRVILGAQQKSEA